MAKINGNGTNGIVTNGGDHPYGRSISLPDQLLDSDLSDENDEQVVCDDADISPRQRSNDEMQRVKRRAIRPSKSLGENGTCDAAGDIVNGLNGLRNGSTCPKKFTKNSRRGRGKFGRGLAKKGGAGGKGTWGIPGSELVGVEEEPNDPLDPNYDSDDAENCKFEAITPPLSEEDIEKAVIPLINEYYEHGDTEEVIMSLEEMNFGENPHHLLVVVISLAMERKASNRELTSVLVSDFYGRILVEEDIEKGFDVLLRNLGDLILDTPTAPTVLGNFIARAIADDCIPPKYVQAYRAPNDSVHARNAIDHANVLLNMKHGLVRLDTVWGVCGGMRPVKYLIRQIKLILKEYIYSGDIEEATRCLQELEVPHFHHELVYESVIMVIEDMGDRTMDLICSLLKSLCSAVIVTVDQLKNGFTRVYEEMPEICIDVPLAYQVLEKLVNKADTQGFMPKDVVKSLPSRGRKRFVSEGDGGLVKEDA